MNRRKPTLAKLVITVIVCHNFENVFKKTANANELAVSLIVSNAWPELGSFIRATFPIVGSIDYCHCDTVTR